MHSAARSVWDRVSDPVRPSKARQGLTLPNQAKIAIVAALEREVRPLIQQWKPVEREYDGREYKFFENDRAVLVCGGIGPEAARRATEAIIRLYAPVLVQSVGFAGALDSTLKVGTVLARFASSTPKMEAGLKPRWGIGCWSASISRPASSRKPSWRRPTGRTPWIWKRPRWPGEPRHTTSPSSG